MRECRRLAHLVWTVRLDEIERCDASARIEEDKNENMTPLLNMFQSMALRYWLIW